MLTKEQLADAMVEFAESGTGEFADHIAHYGIFHDSDNRAYLSRIIADFYYKGNDNAPRHQD